MRPYHWIQVAAILVSLYLLALQVPGETPANWTRSPMGWVTGLLLIVFVVVSLLAGAIGVMIALRMRSLLNLALGLGAIAAAIAVLVRLVFLPLR